MYEEFLKRVFTEIYPIILVVPNIWAFWTQTRQAPICQFRQ